MRDWLRYEAGIRAEQRRIARRRARAPQRRGGKTIAETPRWLASLNLGLGALVLAQKVSPAWWFGLLFVLALFLTLLAAVWKLVVVAVVAYFALKLVRGTLGRYLQYRRDSAEIPF